MASRVPQLPAELWDMILRFACTPVREPHVGRLRLQAYVAPITVSQVCRGWRHFVITHPKYWTVISYAFVHFFSTPKPSPQLMHVFLERSTDLPLTVNLDIEEDSLESRPAAHGFLVALLVNLKRWQSAKLHISLKNDAIFETWEDLGIDGAPLLESLEMFIQPVERAISTDEGWPTILLQAAPKLTKLAICLEDMTPIGEYDPSDSDPEDVISDWALTSGIPYQQLTHLLLDVGPSGDLTWREIASIFERAQDLVSCSFRGINGDRNLPRVPPQPVLLQHLQHLDLSGSHMYVDEGTFMPSMNQTLTAPSLQSLSLLHADDMWNAAAYEQFIERSGCPLTYLHFGLFSEDGPDNLLNCIRLSPPTLRSVHTTRLAALSSEFAERMAEWCEETGEFKLCPLLEQIAINISNPLSLSDSFKGMADMLKKRLCPPDDSSGLFQKLVVSPSLRDKLVDLDDLLEDLYGLRVEYEFLYPEARAMFGI